MPVKKILIIDGDEDFYRAMKKDLKMKTRFQVLKAIRGDEGIRLAKTQKPDLILLDVMMPGISGTQVTEKLEGNHVIGSMEKLNEVNPHGVLHNITMPDMRGLDTLKNIKE